MSASDQVEQYIASNLEWGAALKMLRALIQAHAFEETIKWGAPVYTHQGKNLVGMLAFKNYVGIWFYQGVMLKDKAKKLTNAQQGKTKAMRQWRFKSMEELKQNQKLIKTYLEETIANQQQGKVFKASKPSPLTMPVELADYFKKHPGLKKKFEALLAGQQKIYLKYIHEAKRLPTKLKRIDKIAPLIEAGKGLYDHYK